MQVNITILGIIFLKLQVMDYVKRKKKMKI